MALYTGYYINRDQDIERRVAIEAQIAALDPPGRYRRFSAVDGHYHLLRMHQDNPAHLHILEDDCLMSRQMVYFADRTIADGTLDALDILFLETALPNEFKYWRWARALYAGSISRAADGSVTDVRFSFIRYLGCMTSYLVNRRSIALICECLAEELASGRPRPVDIAIKHYAAEGRLRVASLFPFITSVQPEAFAPTVQHERHKYSKFAMEMLRQSFHVDCDVARAAKVTEEWLGGRDPTSLERLHQRIAKFMASDQFREPTWFIDKPE
jgi:hypothetical protein